MNIRKIILAIWAFVLPAMMYGQYTIQCEDTCNHVHGLDMSHYQGEVFWEAIGNNSKMAYVYLKATEGGTNIDKRYAQNIALAKQYGLKVGSYHFYRPTRPQVEQLRNFRYQCQAKDQDLIPMVDIETTGGLRREALVDSLHKFLLLMERAYHCKPLIYTYEFLQQILTERARRLPALHRPLLQHPARAARRPRGLRLAIHRQGPHQRRQRLC